MITTAAAWILGNIVLGLILYAFRPWKEWPHGWKQKPEHGTMLFGRKVRK